MVACREQDALLVVDLQPDFLPGGALAVGGGDEIVQPIAALVTTCQERGLLGTIVATQDWHPPGHLSFASRHRLPPFSAIDWQGSLQTLWPDHCVQGTPGAALVPQLPTEALHLILRKGSRADADSYSAFRENIGVGGTRRPTGLAGYLRERGVTRVWVCGLARDYCVAWTAIDAVQAGFAACLLDDLSRAVAPAQAAQTDEALRQAGVQITSSQALLQPEAR